MGGPGSVHSGLSYDAMALELSRVQAQMRRMTEEQTELRHTLRDVLDALGTQHAGAAGSSPQQRASAPPAPHGAGGAPHYEPQQQPYSDC